MLKTQEKISLKNCKIYFLKWVSMVDSVLQENSIRMGQQRKLSEQCWIQLELFWQLLVYLVLFGLVLPNMQLSA